MKTLILLGNGFDLAHNLLSRYSDVIMFYLNEAVKEASNKRGKLYIDSLMSLNTKALSPEKRDLSLYEINSVFNHEDNYHKFENIFLARTYNDLSNKRWVDIELMYYKELTKIFKSRGSNEQVSKLNQDLVEIKNLMIRYLVHNVENKVENIDLIEGFSEIFNKACPDNAGTTVLNFNYTSTIEKYMSSDKIIYIHGRLNSETNPVVFGYGNANNDMSEELRKSENDEMLEHYKRYQYSFASNYRKLIQFTQEAFKVIIVGHSCGQSDNVLLNEIFDNPNCRKIRYYYHLNKDDFGVKSKAILRHFHNEIEYNKKLDSFDVSEPCPQMQGK